MITMTDDQLREMVRKIVADEIAKSQTNSASTAQLERFAEIAASKGAAPATSAAHVPSNAWPITRGLDKVEEHVTKVIGWNLDRLISGFSSTIVVGTGLWLLGMPIFKRYPNEMETKIADLRERDPGESYGMEPLFGRTDFDTLINKPRAMSNRLFNIFLPEKWKLVAAQMASRWWPEFPFMRFRDGSIFSSLGSFIKVNASNKPLLKESIRNAHERLGEEVGRVDGGERVPLLCPMHDGEEAVAVLTYERWRTRVNRALVAPTKDLCALLINPCRFFDQVISAYTDPAAARNVAQVTTDLTGLLRKFEIAVGIMEGSPSVLGRYLEAVFPKSWAKAREHARELRPLLVLKPRDGLAYVTRYMLELERRGDVTPLDTARREHLHELKEQLGGYFKARAMHGCTRSFGEVHPNEEERFTKLWNMRPTLMQRSAHAARHLQAAARWIGGERQWAALRPEPMHPGPYHWFGEVRLPDPSL
jgi:hypothetical protein